MDRSESKMQPVVHEQFRLNTEDNLRLYAQSWAPRGDARGVVCLVHGLGEHGGRYARLATYCAERGYAFLTCDLRGHGRSEGRRGELVSYERVLDDIGLLLTEATRRHRKAPRFLYGHSMGGNLVLNYILRRQTALEGAIVTGPWLRVLMDIPEKKRRLARILLRVWPTFAQATGLEAANMAHDPEVVKRYETDSLNHDVITLRTYFALEDAAEYALQHAEECAVPLLLMHGGDDAICDPEASREFAGAVDGDCTLRIWDGLYHEIHNEACAEDVFEVTFDWIKAHTPHSRRR